MKNLLSDYQFGFREGLSTLHAIEEVLKIANIANNGLWGRREFCAVVTLDIRNAFNSVS